MTVGITEIGELAKVLNYDMNYLNANTPDDAVLQKKCCSISNLLETFLLFCDIF